MRVAVDTSAYAALCRGDAAILEILKHCDWAGVPAVALGELYSGFRRGTRWSENKAILDRFLAKPHVRILPVTEDTAVRYGDIDSYLRSVGRPIPRNDVWIAASAIEHGLHLVTLDHHFRLIPLLPVLPVSS